MRAEIIQFNRAIGNYQARTENNIALSFRVLGDEQLRLNEQLEVDLLNLVTDQRILRISDGKYIQIQIGSHDLHDLNLPMAYGASRAPSNARLAGGK